MYRLLFEMSYHSHSVWFPPVFDTLQYGAFTYLSRQLLFAMAIAVYFRPPASLTYLALRFSLSFFVRCISISRCAKCLIF